MLWWFTNILISFMDKYIYPSTKRDYIKNWKKKSANFLKMDIFKMSKNKNLQQMFVKKSNSLVYTANSES
jgi:hypothetical protein